jgi:hypothetical protein
MNTTLSQVAETLRNYWKPIVVVLAALILLSFLWGIFNQGTKKPLPKNLTATLISNELAGVPGSEVRFPALNLTDDGIYYLSDSGTTLYQMDLDGGNKHTLSDKIFPNPMNLVWSPNRSRLLVKVINYKAQLSQLSSPFYAADAGEQEVTIWIYELSSKKISRLPAGLGNVSWSTDSTSLFFDVDFDPGLFKLKLDGSPRVKIVTSKYDSIVAKPSPDGRLLAWYPKPEGYGDVNVHLFNLTTGTQDDLTTDGYSQGANWSPDNTELLVDLIDTKTFASTLTVMDVASKKRTVLNIGGGSERAVWEAGSTNFYTYIAATKSLVMVDKSGQATELIKIEQGLPGNLMLDPAATRLLYTVGNSLYSINLR